MAHHISARALIVAIVLVALALPSSLLSMSIHRLTSAVIAITSYKPVFAMPSSYNISAIATRNNASIIQCWQLSEPLRVFSKSSIAGAAMQYLGRTDEAVLGYVPAKYLGYPHPTSPVKYVVYLAGQCEITFPDSKESAIFGAGAENIIIAADTRDKTKLRHISRSLGQPVTTVEFPIRNGIVPDHKVLHDGQCRAEELQLPTSGKHWW